VSPCFAGPHGWKLALRAHLRGLLSVTSVVAKWSGSDVDYGTCDLGRKRLVVFAPEYADVVGEAPLAAERHFVGAAEISLAARPWRGFPLFTVWTLVSTLRCLRARVAFVPLLSAGLFCFSRETTCASVFVFGCSHLFNGVRDLCGSIDGLRLSAGLVW
jgi:hypothetical protein